MNRYTKVEIAEQQLEDIVRRNAGLIEDGLTFVDHQKAASAGRRLDVLLVDSGRSLVVAELKVVQDDGMLMQGVDYYDDVTNHLETYARLYKNHNIDPTQQVRLFLIAPSFSQTLINRCKWIDLPVSLFTVNCLKFDGQEDIVPVFAEQAIPTSPRVVEISTFSDHLDYITDLGVRTEASALLDEIAAWKQGNISLDPIKDAISMKVNGRVFAYFFARRKFYLLGTYNDQEDWFEQAIKDHDDLAKLKPILRAAMERRAK